MDTEEFHKNAPCVEMFAIMPAFMLKKFILNAYPQTPQEIMIIRSIDFMIDKLESLSQKQIASRMTLNCTPRYIQKLQIPDEKITIIDVSCKIYFYKTNCGQLTLYNSVLMIQYIQQL